MLSLLAGLVGAANQALALGQPVEYDGLTVLPDVVFTELYASGTLPEGCYRVLPGRDAGRSAYVRVE